MSDDTLSQLVADHIAKNISPVVKWLYGVFASVIAGTCFIVSMWYDLKQGTANAASDAANARKHVEESVQPMLNNHETRIAVLESLRASLQKP